MARQVKAFRQGSRKGEQGYAHREHVSKRNRTRHPSYGMRPLAPRGSKSANRWRMPYNKRMPQERQPTKKELRSMRKEVRKQATTELHRLRMAAIAHRPWYLPRFLWGRIVAMILDAERGEGRG